MTRLLLALLPPLRAVLNGWFSAIFQASNFTAQRRVKKMKLILDPSHFAMLETCAVILPSVSLLESILKLRNWVVMFQEPLSRS